MAKSKVTILGAGLSGMVAGINLAREGYEVEIIDGAKTLGQLEDFHPSIHATPINPRRVSNYIGIDVTPCFTAVDKLRINVEKERYDLNPTGFYLVERGGRKESIDTYLYNMAVEMGIKFHFNQYVTNLDDIPDDAIVATGFNKDFMAAIGVEYGEGTGAYARKKLDDPYWDATCVGWAGKYTTDYGYLSVANDMMFFLILARYQMTEKDIEECKQHLEATDGLTFPKWTFVKGYFPKLTKDTLKIFIGNRILTGTICGMIDPSALYGIHGALLSGRIASLIKTDTEKGLDDFKQLNKNFHRVRILSDMMRKMPGRLPLTHLMFSYPSLMKPALGILDDAIPGYDRHWAKDMMVGRKKLS